ncbi:hypothetical protein SAMN03159488_00828 [Pseudomonas sp. NFIX10]|nr:hypothetical protein SAMN03159488_00828 [Pseudomonas sp. NFIX10]SFE27285.1 hypothetical protein SAMN03159367_00796 [Pseudomonas sp. NFACC06-1]
MKPFRIRELQMTDVQALLAFEIHNREWFESQIDARDPAFYSWTGVTNHIEGYLADFCRGRLAPVCDRRRQRENSGAGEFERHPFTTRLRRGGLPH